MLVQSMMLLLHVDASLNTEGLVDSQNGYICGVTDKSLLEKKRRTMVSNGLAIIQNEPDKTELVGCGSTSNVRSLGLCRVGNAVSAGIDSWTSRSAGCSNNHAGETSTVCYRLQKLVRSFVSCGKPVNAARH